MSPSGSHLLEERDGEYKPLVFAQAEPLLKVATPSTLGCRVLCGLGVLSLRSPYRSSWVACAVLVTGARINSQTPMHRWHRGVVGYEEQFEQLHRGAGGFKGLSVAELYRGLRVVMSFHGVLQGFAGLESVLESEKTRSPKIRHPGAAGGSGPWVAGYPNS